MRSAPQSRLLAAISLINLIVSCESLGLLERAFDVCFQNARKSSRWKPQKRLRLDDKERLFPGPSHSSEKYQEHSICFPADWSFDLSTQDDQLLSQQRVFRQQFGFASGQISKRFGHKRGRQWFDPSRNTFLERMHAKTDALLDRGKYAQHEWNLLFVKIGAWSEHMYSIDRVDCTRI
jgi:hypothetical protein